ncbi:MAG: hypothetical protein H7X95_11165 [Deltaproteobacteria bacterium]|nr:hypothetical protein [Deltaproteobacteria bacterium]
MSVRTSTVVAGGIALLAVIGITTIFGESFLAVVAPPQADLSSGALPGNSHPPLAPKSLPNPVPGPVNGGPAANTQKSNP